MAERILVQLKDGDGNALYPEIAGECVPDGAVATDKLADGAVTEAKLGAELAKEIASSKTMADTLLEGLEDPAHLEDPFVKAGIIPIPLEDEEVKKVLVENFDKDGDGEISYAEAQAVTEWPAELFNGNTRIRKFRELRFFGGLTRIAAPGNYWDDNGDGGAFGGCANLTDIEFPQGIGALLKDYAGGKMFWGCGRLALAKLPDGWTRIGYAMFRHCGSLGLAYLPDGLTDIADYAFQGCTSLALTSLPDTVASIGSYAFQGCTSLALTSLPDTVASIGSCAFQGCTSLALTSLPDWMTEIPYGLFWGCTKLALTELPDSVTTIDWYAFSGCTGLKTLTIGKNITVFQGGDFRGCTGLRVLTILAATPPTYGLAMFEGMTDFTIYVPDDAVETYKAATGWAGYAGRIKGVSEKSGS